MTIAASSSTVETGDEGVTVGSGDLAYSMNIDAGFVGGNSVISITPNHNISGIGAR